MFLVGTHVHISSPDSQWNALRAIGCDVLPQHNGKCLWSLRLSYFRRHFSTIRPSNQWTYPYCLRRVFLSFEAEATTLDRQPQRNVSNVPFCMRTRSKQAIPFLHGLLQPYKFMETLSYSMRFPNGNDVSVQSTAQ